jgi:hypothetical protein
MAIKMAVKIPPITVIPPKAVLMYAITRKAELLFIIFAERSSSAMSVAGAVRAARSTNRDSHAHSL